MNHGVAHAARGILLSTALSLPAAAGALGVDEYLAQVARHNPELAAATPGLGVAAGAMQALGHGYEAYTHIDEIDKGYQNNQFWTETGNATLGAANAIAALDPTGISSLYVGGTQMALDGIGALSGWIGGEDYRVSAGSAIGAAEHLVFDGGQALASGVMSAGSAIGGAVSDGVGAVGSAISDW